MDKYLEPKRYSGVVLEVTEQASVRVSLEDISGKAINYLPVIYFPNGAPKVRQRFSYETSVSLKLRSKKKKGCKKERYEEQ